MSDNKRCATNESPCDQRRASSDNVCRHYPVDDTETTHTALCEEYWDRGLECQCIPEGVKDAIRRGANPEDVM